ncbi:MAG: phytanoyl-CoA dioxygenase family protein [Bauldia sp.]|nr:phytanoyl-CoA dioxygenase family protein [Bauldia sp.]
MKVTGLSIMNRRGQHRVFGLVGFGMRLSGAEPSVVLSFEAADKAQSLALEEMVDGRLGSDREIHRFSLVTHLLPNGPCVLKVRAADGRVLAAYDLLVDNQGPLAAAVASQLIAQRTRFVLGAEIDASIWPYESGELIAWFDSNGVAEPSVTRERPSLEPLTDIAQSVAHMRDFGFTVLPETVPEEWCDELNRMFDQGVASGEINYTWGSSQRILGLHRSSAGRRIWTYAPVIQFLRQWFRDEPVACQTLYYCFGSQQRAHQDTIHLTPYPAGYMCGVWVALQDVEQGSGELFVIPGSHKLRRIRGNELELDKVNEDYSAYAKFDNEIANMVSVTRLETVPYRPKKGTILVWHENLIHGGEPRANKELPRRSIVSHYFAKGAIAYYDSRGEPAALEEI